MEGVLWKWTNYWNGWQTRWFVLENSVLAYYKSQDEVNQGCKGSIKVSAAEIIAHPGGEGTRMDIVVPGEQHFYLRAPSFKERQQWLVALGSAKQSNTIGDGPPPVPLSLVLGSGDAADARRESLAARAALRRRTSSSSSSNAVVPRKQLDPQAPGGKERETKRPATAEELYGFMQAQEKIWEKRYRRLDGKVSMALSMLTELKKELKSKPVVNEESISVNRKFPLKTLDDVEELERELSEDVFLHNNLVTQLARICGDEEQPSVYKILYFVFTDEAAKHFCLTGKSGVEGMKKKKFMGTKICSVIMGVNDAQSVYAALRSRRGELRLYCDLIIQQVHEIQAVSSFIKDNQNAISDGSAKPHLERMHEAASVLGPTCDSFVEALEECLETVSPSMHQPPSSRSNHSSEH